MVRGKMARLSLRVGIALKGRSLCQSGDLRHGTMIESFERRSLLWQRAL